MLFIDDLLDAYVAAVARIDVAAGNIFNLGGGPGNALSLRELVGKLDRLNPRPLKVGFADWRPGDQRVFIADIRKARRELGWEPRVGVDEGLKRLHRWVSETPIVVDAGPRAPARGRRPPRFVRVALLTRAVFPLHDPGGNGTVRLSSGSPAPKARHRNRSLHSSRHANTARFPGEVVTVPYEDFRLGAHGRVLDRTLNYPRFALRMGALVAEAVRAGRVDVVHAQGVAGLGYARRRAADRTLTAPLLLNPQGMEEHKTRGLKRLALTRLRRLSRETARLADRVIATDEVTKDEVPHFLGVEPSRVVVLPNGIDLDEIAEATPANPRARGARAGPVPGRRVTGPDLGGASRALQGIRRCAGGPPRASGARTPCPRPGPGS